MSRRSSERAKRSVLTKIQMTNEVTRERFRAVFQQLYQRTWRPSKLEVVTKIFSKIYRKNLGHFREFISEREIHCLKQKYICTLTHINSARIHFLTQFIIPTIYLLMQFMFKFKSNSRTRFHTQFENNRKPVNWEPTNDLIQVLNSSLDSFCWSA
jgi:hypothetical protein